VLTIRESKNARSVTEYFLNHQDYVLDDGAPPPRGCWGGKGAEHLGLAGEVDRQAFARLASNIHPGLDERLTLRWRLDRRVGYDVCFACPKSVSVTYWLTGEQRILDAVRAADARTMAQIESDARARVRRGGQSDDRVSGNLVWAEFSHMTTRPVKGVPDPHLHVHHFIFNMTFDPTEGRWKALQFGDIIRHRVLYQAIYLAELARGLESLGFTIERGRHSWELGGFARSTIEKFSNRTAQIEAESQRRGITDARSKGKLGATLREPKREPLHPDLLRMSWTARLTSFEREAIANLLNYESNGHSESPIREAVESAQRTAFHRSAIVRESTFLADALMHAPGQVTVDGVREEMRRQGITVEDRRGIRMASAEHVKQDEQRLMKLVQAGRGSVNPVGGTIRSKDLTMEEQRAVRYVLDTSDRVCAIRAAPGVDIAKVMRTVHHEVRRQSLRGVKVFTPSKQAAAKVRADARIKNATTLRQLFTDPKVKRKSFGDILWVHEAGQIGLRDMTRLVKQAKRFGARVVLSTGSYTERSASRGNLVDLLEKHANLSSLKMRRVTEPLGEHRKALEALNRGKTLLGLRMLDRVGGLRESDPDARAKTIADQCLSAWKSKQWALAVAQNANEKKRFNEAIRTEFIEHGIVRSAGRRVQVLQSLHMSETDRAKPESFRRGMISKFHLPTPGFKPGSEWKILGRDPFGNVVARNGLRFQALPLTRAHTFDVYERTKIEVAKGDIIRLTHGGRANGHGPRGNLAPIDWAKGNWRQQQRELHAGQMFGVRRVTVRGQIVLDNGLRLDPRYQHFEHGYSVTAGTPCREKVDRVFMSCSSIEGQVSKDTVSTWLSKAKAKFTLYTDSVERLAKSLTGEPLEQPKPKTELQQPEREREQRRDREIKMQQHRQREESARTDNQRTKDRDREKER
jgi:conjugative relaxase-like TrwC/TraI family protein